MVLSKKIKHEASNAHFGGHAALSVKSMATVKTRSARIYYIQPRCSFSTTDWRAIITEWPNLLKLLKQAETLLNDTTELLRKDQSPVFYKVPHCTECQLKDNCYKKLRDKDCISLLAGMTPKAMAKYHNKGITTITQLSYLFKPRRRRAPNPQSSYLWELKALAIREQKTFVIEPPTFPYSPVAIYVDFEGTSDENHIYLIGALIIKDGQPDENFSFWSNHKEQEETNFTNLFNVFHQYSDAPICHYGSYERISCNANFEPGWASGITTPQGFLLYLLQRMSLQSLMLLKC